MKPDLGDAFLPSFDGRPPHMSAIDFVLWQRFRAAGNVTYERMYFDVAVGPGVAGAPGVDPAVLAAWERITRQRIDVVGESSSGWTIIEIRGAAGPGAIGSLMVYRDLWIEDPPDSRPLSLILVTDVFSEALVGPLKRLPAALVLV